MKGKYYVFCGYKETNTMYFVYLECRMPQDNHGWTMPKNHTKNIFRDNQTINKPRLTLLDLCVLT